MVVFGSVNWDGNDSRDMLDALFGRHVNAQVGDTV